MSDQYSTANPTVPQNLIMLVMRRYAKLHRDNRGPYVWAKALNCVDVVLKATNRHNTRQQPGFYLTWNTTNIVQLCTFLGSRAPSPTLLFCKQDVLYHSKIGYQWLSKCLWNCVESHPTEQHMSFRFIVHPKTANVLIEIMLLISIICNMQVCLHKYKTILLQFNNSTIATTGNNNNKKKKKDKFQSTLHKIKMCQ